MSLGLNLDTSTGLTAHWTGNLLTREAHSSTVGEDCNEVTLVIQHNMHLWIIIGY